MDPINTTDRLDLQHYTRRVAATQFYETVNAAALAQTVLEKRTPDNGTVYVLARHLLGTARALLAALDALTDTQLAIACHVAASDDGEDPTTADLLAALAKAGQPIGKTMLAAGMAEQAGKSVPL
ncbi:hypothetical protein OG357_23105 [Streptomyces sp. NBC_01255]|uniref:hypothetical protein n=1 Tax=Streptomyces sp. NBC_01255 TaxID=2903798 RepID=UPI002E349498|nr:hypothetical protein [Streptomyces sp. NBC_01255]